MASLCRAELCRDKCSGHEAIPFKNFSANRCAPGTGHPGSVLNAASNHSRGVQDPIKHSYSTVGLLDLSQPYHAVEQFVKRLAVQGATRIPFHQRPIGYFRVQLYEIPVRRNPLWILCPRSRWRRRSTASTAQFALMFRSYGNRDTTPVERWIRPLTATTNYAIVSLSIQIRPFKTSNK